MAGAVSGVQLFHLDVGIGRAAWFYLVPHTSGEI
jgi:hypothetical protein